MYSRSNFSSSSCPMRVWYSLQTLTSASIIRHNTCTNVAYGGALCERNTNMNTVVLWSVWWYILWVLYICPLVGYNITCEECLTLEYGCQCSGGWTDIYLRLHLQRSWVYRTSPQWCASSRPLCVPAPFSVPQRLSYAAATVGWWERGLSKLFLLFWEKVCSLEWLLTLSFFFLSGVMKPFFAFLALEASSMRLRTSARLRSISACLAFFAWRQWTLVTSVLTTHLHVGLVFLCVY